YVRVPIQSILRIFRAGAGRLWRFDAAAGSWSQTRMETLLRATSPGTMLFFSETGSKGEKAGIPPLAWSNGCGACSPRTAADGSYYWLHERPLARQFLAFGCCISPRLARGRFCGGQKHYD